MAGNALPPAAIAVYASDAGVKKAALLPVHQFVLGILAGAFIAFASEGSNMAAFNLLADPSTYGLGRCVAGVVFPTGLMLVVLAGGELFTGNTMMSIALVQRRITLGSMLSNWVWVYLGNLAGSLLLAYMMAESGLFKSGGGLLGGVTISIAVGKVSHSFSANLLPVTLGNIVGGGVFVGMAYWFVYLRRDGRE